MPRLLPRGVSLVKANGRVSLSGILGATISAPLAGLASLVGPEWSLRYAFVLFVVATVFAIKLPERVDSSVGEEVLVLMAPGDSVRVGAPAPGRRGSAPAGARPRTRIPTSVAFALRANCGPRWLSGFLLMFMAFLLRENPPESGLRAEVLIGLVVAAAGLGNAGGVAVASLLRNLHPGTTVVLVLVLDAAAALLATVFYGVLPLVALGLCATIQSDVPTKVQASAFARSDTTLQLAWVVGGFVGIALPLDPPRLGLGVAFAVLAAWMFFVLAGRSRRYPGEVPVTG